MNVALRPRSLDFISICSGGGGLDLGVELAIPNARSVVYVEREAFAVATLVSAMEEGFLVAAPIWSDARTFDGRTWRGSVDAIISGIPCQPHSVAGRKRGSLDERDMWSTTKRIIVQARPWFVLIENVSGMLTAGADEIAGAERVWRDLRKFGFAVEIGLFHASEVGAPHERERVFILGVADSNGRYTARRSTRRFEEAGRRPYSQSSRSGEVVADAEGSISKYEWAVSCREPRRPSDARTELANTHIPQLRGQPPARQQQIIHRDYEIGIFPPGPGDIDTWRQILVTAPHFEPAVCGLADGLAAARIDWLRLLGNGVVPLQAAYAVSTLATRLAARCAAGADRLIRMMADIS